MNFTIRTFYKIGAVLMCISTLGALMNLLIIWNISNIGVKISTLFGGVLFTFLLFLFFAYMYKQTPDAIIDDSDVDMLIKQIQGGEQNVIRKKAKAR